MKFSAAAFCVLTTIPLVASQNPAEEVKGGMNLRGDLLENPIQADPLGVGDADDLDTETTTTVPPTETTTPVLTVDMVEIVKAEHCNRWQLGNDYPAGIYCTLMETEKDRRSELGFYFEEMYIDKLRKYTVKSMPEGRQWNESAFLEALANQTALGRLSRQNNIFSVEVEYVKEYAMSIDAVALADEEGREGKTSKSNRRARNNRKKQTVDRDWFHVKENDERIGNEFGSTFGFSLASDEKKDAYCQRLQNVMNLNTYYLYEATLFQWCLFRYE